MEKQRMRVFVSLGNGTNDRIVSIDCQDAQGTNASIKYERTQSQLMTLRQQTQNIAKFLRHSTKHKDTQQNDTQYYRFICGIDNKWHSP